MKRTFRYDPSASWVIYDIRPSLIPNVGDVLVSVNNVGNGAPLDIYVSTEPQNAIVGAV